MGAASDTHRRNNDSVVAGSLRASARMSAAKGLLAAGVTFKTGVYKKSFEETRVSVQTKQRLNQEYPSLQDLELLRTLGMARQPLPHETAAQKACFLWFCQA